LLYPPILLWKPSFLLLILEYQGAWDKKGNPVHDAVESVYEFPDLWDAPRIVNHNPHNTSAAVLVLVPDTGILSVIVSRFLRHGLEAQAQVPGNVSVPQGSVSFFVRL
jgi:hypothetical protein